MEPKKRLLDYTQQCGCASKLPHDLLVTILSEMAPQANDRIIIGASGDDSAIIKDQNGDLIITTDIGTPISNDPFVWAEVYTLHVLSDIFAMGGRPYAAIMQLGVPYALIDDMRLVVKGVQSCLSSMNVSLVGGHTFISENAPILGLTAIGKPEKNILRKATPKKGDDIILTKPLGIGLYLGASKTEGVLTDFQYSELLRVCKQSNSFGIELSTIDGVTSCTDVTGWGLLGEIGTIITTTGMGVELHLDSIPYMTAAHELSSLGYWASIGMQNCSSWQHLCKSPIDSDVLAVLADPQTSGGLLFTSPPSLTSTLIAKSIMSGNVWTSRVGKIIEESSCIDFV